MNKKQTFSVGGAIVYKDSRGKRKFLLVKQDKEDDWEIAKVSVRKGESSVRSVIRMTGEMANINAKVLEEAGRASGATTVNGKVVPQKYYYYLMVLKAGSSEAIGFFDTKWMEYSKALSSLKLKREKEAFKNAKKVLKQWEKDHPNEK